MDETSRCDFSWILFVGTKLLSFSEKEVGHMTLRKWNLLFNHYKNFHNFKTQGQLFKTDALIRTNDEWLKD